MTALFNITFTENGVKCNSHINIAIMFDAMTFQEDNFGLRTCLNNEE